MLIRTIIVVSGIIFSTLNIAAQTKYFVKFTDKNDSPYSINNPSAFLSERAITRRTKQNINITAEDLPVNPSYIQQVSQTGVNVDYSLRWFNGIVITVFNSDQINSIENLPFVSGTEKIFKFSQTGGELSIDVSNLPKWNNKNSAKQELDYGPSYDQIKLMNGLVMHNNGFLGEGIQIALLDAGYLNVDNHTAFDSLRVHGRILGLKDFINPSSNLYNEHYHGTMVLSTIGGYSESKLIGTAPRAKFWLIRTENANLEQIYEEYAWAAGAEFADSAGVDIINSSLGYSTFDITNQNHTYADLNGNTTPITKAANIASSKGMVVVVSAGNEGDDPWHFISAPADSPSVLTVGATDKYGNIAYFSSVGPTSDNRIKPDVCAMGQAAVVANPSGIFSLANGTSFSAPIIAGMVACLWQAKPHLKANEIIHLIKTSSSIANSPNNTLGYGIPNFEIASEIKPTNSNNATLKLFPNPFENNLFVSIPEVDNEMVECSLISMLGNEVFTAKKIVTNSIFRIESIPNLAKGNYIIRVKTSQNVYLGKGIRY